MCFECMRGAVIEIAVLSKPLGASLQCESDGGCVGRGIECEQTREQKVLVHSAIEKRFAEHYFTSPPTSYNHSQGPHQTASNSVSVAH